MNYINEVKNLHEKKPFAVVNTFGCRQNENDSEKIAGLLEQMGYGFTDDPNTADLIVFNTCAVRENAENRVYGMIGALKPIKRRRPDITIALCGCMAGEEHTVEKIKTTFEHVDIVFGTNSIFRLPELLFEILKGKKRILGVAEDNLIHEDLPILRKSSLAAGVPIMYGCNNFCSYCIVPYVRGRERSRNAEDIIAEVRELAANGCMEVTLLGQNVNSYGGGGDSFAKLLSLVSDTGIPRIRFMTSHPKDISDDVIDTMAKRENICKALHLPIQCGSDRVLSLMNRKYTRQWYLQCVDKVRQAMPDIALTTDIIVGFPGETTQDFEETLDVLRQVRFDMLFSFIFSPRRGTPAEKMEDSIPTAEKKDNFGRLLELQNQISLEKNKGLVGKTVSVLVEGVSKTNSEALTGRTEGGKIVNFIGDKNLTGQILPVKITHAGTFNLTGEPGQ